MFLTFPTSLNNTSISKLNECRVYYLFCILNKNYNTFQDNGNDGTYSDLNNEEVVYNKRSYVGF